MDQEQQQEQSIKPIEEAAEQSKLDEPSDAQKTSDALNNAGSAVAETTSGWYDSIKKALGMGSTTTNPSGNTGGGRRKKKRTKRSKKSAKKTKRSKK